MEYPFGARFAILEIARGPRIQKEFAYGLAIGQSAATNSLYPPMREETFR